MNSRNISFRIPQTIWRIVKIDARGKFWTNESKRPVDVKEVPQIRSWKKLEKELSELPPAYVDILYIEKGFSEALPETALIKIMNSDAMILIYREQKEPYQNLLVKIGYQIDLSLPSLPDFLVFRKNIIPCCGS